MRRLLIILFLFVLLIPNVQAQDRDIVTIGILIDGDDTRSIEFVHELDNELKKLLGSKYTIQIPSSKILLAEWSVDNAEANYESLTEDREVDIIVILGVLSGSIAASKGQYKKPVIVLGIFDPVLQGITPAYQNSSGIHNLTYVLFNQSIIRDLDVFYRLYPYKKVGIVSSGGLLKLILGAQDPLQSVMEKNKTDFKPLPLNNSIDEVLNSLEGVDAVYLSHLGKFERTEEKKGLIKELNKRTLPTFGFSLRDIQLGILASAAPEENLLKIRRRMALNIEAILNGGDPANLPVHISFAEKLTINMQTAREIGFSPKFDVMSEAELMNEFTDEGSRVITLLDVMYEAINANLDLKIEEGSVKSAEKDLSLARSNYFPSITVSASGTQIEEEQAKNSMGQQAERTTSGNVNVNQLIFSEEQIGNVTVQEYLLRASEYIYDQRKLDVVLDAATAYFNVLKARTAMSIQNENINLTRKNLEISKQREAAGYSGRSDVYRWESSMASAATDLLGAKNSYKLSKIQLNQLLNRSLEEDFTAGEASLSDNMYGSYLKRARAFVDNPDSLDKYTGFLIEEAALNSPAVRQIDANIDALERRLTSFKLKRFVPAINLGADAQRLFSRDGAGSDVAGVDPDNESWSVGLSLSIPLFEGGATQHNIGQTKIEIRKLRDQRAQLLQSLEFNVRAAVLDLVNNVVNLRSSQRSAEFSEKSLELVQDSYSRGKVSIADLLDAQNSSLTAELTALNSVYDFMISLLETEKAVGRYTLLTAPSEQEDYIRRLQEYFSGETK